MIRIMIDAPADALRPLAPPAIFAPAPREVSFHSDFPRDTAGKLVKRLLREPYWAGRATRV